MTYEQAQLMLDHLSFIAERLVAIQRLLESQPVGAYDASLRAG